ncbi:alpha/beta hydrolase [Limnochorda pilosa]|uniref:Alpha/beta hydrolase n=1 Tax=Limnochorda pilosa TaxID=1555112 RepID=A0A0K2SK49_LIMPI|nr:alpha/beta hydrolase [Limnochorda pilosa]
MVREAQELRGDREILARGTRWSYREVEGDEPVAVFLHAFPLQKAMWEPVLEALEGRARAVALDLPGFGSSASLPAEPTMDAYADATAGFLDALGIGQAILCGLSMGGYLAFALWRRHRERVAGLVLADTRAGADTAQARQGRYDLVARLELQGARAAAEQFLPNLVGPTTRGRRPELLEHLEGWILANSPQGMAAAARAMAERPDSTDLLAGIDVPALVVVGEEDGLTPPEEAERMAGAIPGATLARIPQAGHLSALEQPGPFNSVLIGFLDRFRAGG